MVISQMLPGSTRESAFAHDCSEPFLFGSLLCVFLLHEGLLLTQNPHSLMFGAF